MQKYLFSLRGRSWSPALQSTMRGQSRCFGSHVNHQHPTDVLYTQSWFPFSGLSLNTSVFLNMSNCCLTYFLLCSLSDDETQVFLFNSSSFLENGASDLQQPYTASTFHYDCLQETHVQGGTSQTHIWYYNFLNAQWQTKKWFVVPFLIAGDEGT